MGISIKNLLPELMVVIAVIINSHAAEKSVITNSHTAEKSTTDVNQTPSQNAREKFLFGSFSTTTYTQVVASTSTVFFSCLSGTAKGTVCQGRGARRAKNLKNTKINIEDDSTNHDIEGSFDQDVTGDSSLRSPGNKPKLAFTIWTTSRTTTSVTVFYTNTSTTIRLSYYCYAGGIQFPQYNCLIT